MNVNFLICGAQKSGTTALDAYLRRHPEVCMARRKELHFFDNERLFVNGCQDYTPYHDAFQRGPQHAVTGEATPIYMYWRSAPKRIWEYNSNMKLIAVLRNPIERAFSHWNMERVRGKDHLPFWEAIQCERQRCHAALPYQHRVFSYVDRGFYTEQLKRIWSFFPREQVLVLRHEDLRLDPKVTLGKICAYLEISPFGEIESKDVHSTPYVFPFTKSERHHLRSIYEFEIRHLESLLDWDCNKWLED